MGKPIFEPKEIDFGFSVLCVDRAVGLLKSTASSISIKYPGRPHICVADESCLPVDLAEMGAICPTFLGGSSVTSLINLAMNNSPAEWNFLIFAGTTLRSKIDCLFTAFMESELDVMFPVVDRKGNFVDGSLNGLLISRKAWKVVGEMAEIGPLEVVKLMWAIDAIESGVKFKAVVGAKMC